MMNQEVLAIFENGQFRPLTPVSLPENGVVSLTVRPPQPDAKSTEYDHQRTIAIALDEAAKLPIQGEDDGFCGADHDAVLYGFQQ